MPLQMFQTISHFIRQALLPVEEAGRGLLWIGLAWCLVSCTGNKVYDHYEQTPTTGWEKNDTLTFGVPPLAVDGLYAIDL
jgi:gliding motility-associated lipoprotein GldH